MLTFTSAQAPVGLARIGALLARRELQLAPIMHGGGQERDVRSARTIDVAATAGFAAALQVATRNRVDGRAASYAACGRELIGLGAGGRAVEAVPYGSRRRGGAAFPGIASIGFPRMFLLMRS